MPALRGTKLHNFAHYSGKVLAEFLSHLKAKLFASIYSAEVFVVKLLGKC